MSAVSIQPPVARPKVLFLAHRVPFPPDKGDRIRSWHMLRFLSQQCDVWLGCLADESWNNAAVDELTELCKAFQIVPLNAARWLRSAWGLATGAPITVGAFSSSQLRRWIRQTAEHVPFDVVIAYCSSMASYVALPELRRIPLIVDLVDVDSEKWRELGRASRWPQRAIYQREATRLQQVEQELGRQAAAVLLVSEAEANLYREHAPDACVHAVSNGVSADFLRKASGASLPENELVFVGALDYRPNVDGMTWFCAEVWPHIIRETPDAVLRIVGRRPVRAVESLAQQPGIRLHANVPDVRPYLSQARIAIAPLQLARGLQNKILEALAHETPVVASPAALTGLNLTPGQDVIAATTAAEWRDAIVSLFRDDTKCRQLAARGRQYVEQHCDWNQCLQPLGRIIETLAGGNVFQPDAEKSPSASVVAASC